MRTWAEAELREINVTETANGGMPSRNYDQQWHDDKGDLYVNFEPEHS